MPFLVGNRQTLRAIGKVSDQIKELQFSHSKILLRKVRKQIILT